ncbi:putative 2-HYDROXYHEPTA-2,4-DIENE-1,7-DIOATE ISOMERASE [Vibrio nigripulchritudo SO65]|uniref:fumarylacetoacetate hydrolase family protein n=1 Tax=Vibrio nigripulchritudo TaxID=28173 RepID=UPI0003B18ADF|nr:fumarylacetoacetate hydrolase family protein [Vibrio nigripulchritudo]CCN37405.1 putative 2-HYDROXYHEPTA-2,4-DIENE-1,7-DIOATE ISOMERASE [Vibrio nigripulchritudo AM115]CCN44440.1 putative 2-HYDROXYHEPTA-2,4-DIENE-1,7-DIOATE ISOMERASE [Vibrio nigripulchritudo FTn2]CCN63141.1 putative 2-HYDROXYHEPTA-2,4-DIENE-1,7-DIOATE ISOMERASE [Vibrio nigripulchritudo POn4]CCN78423.1 putative 2-HYDROXYHEPTA-2,4-DIENE-1,7-DIOATE ISOMERASE [Vibrio nigripulchritudo SO65]
MKTARILKNGKTLNVTIDAEGHLIGPDGHVVPQNDITWLCPIENPGTIFALGLNYADHASELAFSAPEVPLVFIKGANTLTGHRCNTYRPDNVDFMHHECELVAVIGKKGKNIAKEDAMDYVAGYTICNDFAIRDYLENYYRPNLKVKSRDSLCPIGPWLISKEQLPDIDNLALETRVNGEVVQTGNTNDMIFSVPELIAYLSQTLTLQPGDMIATGTPKGLKDTQPGDVVDCSIEGLGTLTTYMVSETEYFERKD